MEEKITKENVEISVVRTDTRRLETRSASHVETIINTLSWGEKDYFIYEQE